MHPKYVDKNAYPKNNPNLSVYATIFATGLIFLFSIILQRSVSDQNMMAKLFFDNKIIYTKYENSEKGRIEAVHDTMVLAGRMRELALRHAMTLEQETQFLFETLCLLDEIFKKYGVTNSK